MGTFFSINGSQIIQVYSKFPLVSKISEGLITFVKEHKIANITILPETESCIPSFITVCDFYMGTFFSINGSQISQVYFNFPLVSKDFRGIDNIFKRNENILCVRDTVI